MLDQALSLVVAGRNLPKLEALDLLARLRASSIRRLRELPFLLIVSDQEDSADREQARVHGVSGVLTKTMKQAEILEVLAGVLAPPPEDLPAVPISKKSKPVTVAPVKSGLLGDADFEQALATVGVPATPRESLSALVFGIDGRAGLMARFGPKAMAQIEERFAALLQGKIAAQDLMGACGEGRLAVIARDVDLVQAVRFGKKVCKSLAAGQITLRKEKVRLTASVGVASSSDDTVDTGADLLALAGLRLNQALVCGGNTVATEIRPGCPGICRSAAIDRPEETRLLEALRAPESITDRGEMAELAQQLLPLLGAMSRQLDLNLPLERIERQLAAEAAPETVESISLE
jgi:diguanylate cyclase (GGDEF)-like protein